MIHQHIREPLERWFCPCVQASSDLSDDGQWVSSPVKIGSSILLYGRRKSAFPAHCLVGPDWPFVCLVLFLIVAVNAVVLGVISPIGWPPVLIGLVGTLVLMVTYCRTAFSDPGIVYRNDCDAPLRPSRDIESIESIESIDDKPTLQTPIMQGEGGPSLHLPHSMDCGQCDFKRPYSARHCDYCGTCVDQLDHHCPWSGKCIGAKNLKAFYLFTGMLCLQIYYLMGCFLYYIIYLADVGAPTGPHF
ncbi:DHHC palmitoyltransferase-domain-containing protein [Ochromonadaceae sp. CCMP2298]|nr:DHHC palmitoyltransferase-domain-containing protein [Ochromonadaceae sp. CCMP2298]